MPLLTHGHRLVQHEPRHRPLCLLGSKAFRRSLHTAKWSLAAERAAFRRGGSFRGVERMGLRPDVREPGGERLLRLPGRAGPVRLRAGR